MDKHLDRAAGALSSNETDLAEEHLKSLVERRLKELLNNLGDDVTVREAPLEALPPLSALPALPAREEVVFGGDVGG